MSIREADLLRAVELVGAQRSVHEARLSARPSEHLHLVVVHMEQLHTVVRSVRYEQILASAVLVQDCGRRGVELGGGVVAETEASDVGSAEDGVDDGVGVGKGQVGDHHDGVFGRVGNPKVAVHAEGNQTAPVEGYNGACHCRPFSALRLEDGGVWLVLRLSFPLL